MQLLRRIFILLLLFLSTSVAGAGTLTLYPTKDGFVSNSGTWATTRSAGTGASVDNSATDSQYSCRGSYFSTYYIARTFASFYVTGLPAGSTVTSANLTIYCRANNPILSPNHGVVCAMEGTQSPTSDLTTADYDAFTGSYFGTATHADETRISISLNAAGITYVSTNDSYVTFCVREYTHDYLNSTPAAVYDAAFYFSENTGTTKDPYLEINYVLVSTLSGTLKEKESDASGAAYDYMLLDTTSSPHAVYAYGTAASDGTWSENVANDTDEYCGVMIDNIGGWTPQWHFGTDTTDGSGNWSITNSEYADGETVWAFFVDPDKVYKTIAAEFTANASHVVSGTHQENGSPASGTLVYSLDFGTSSGTYNPKPIFDFATGN